MIVPFPPGGSNDIMGRYIGHYFTERLGRQVVMDNRPGADGIIGTDIVARSAPDGYTFLMILHSQLAQAPVLLKKVPIDTSRDLVPIAALSTGVGLGVVRKDLPASSVRELVERLLTRGMSVPQPLPA